MSKILTIYEALLNRKEKVCSKTDIIEILKEYNQLMGKLSLTDAVKYLSRHNYVKRIFLNYYYINSADERKRKFCAYEDKELLFMVLGKLKIKWYVGLNSALYLSGKIWQTPITLTIINSRLSGKKTILGLKIRFIKTKESLIFGLKKGKTKNNVAYSYSDIPKTYIDMVYFGKSSKLMAEKGTKIYLKKYPKWLSKSI